MSSILCFHGSPGTPDDFLELEKALEGHTLQRVLRNGYPSNGFTDSEKTPLESNLPQSSVYLGYSWGGLSCLRAAARASHSVAHVILVAPYIYPKPAGGLKKMLLGAPWIGDKLLSSKGPGIIEELLTRSSSPHEVPPSYRARASALAAPEILRRAVFEKEEAAPATDHVLKQLTEAGTSVLIIWGTDDLTSSEEDQVAPLRQALKIEKELKLENAGHALLWTHPNELAQGITDYL